MSKPPLSVLRRTALALDLFVVLTALPCGIALAVAPDGHLLGMSPDLLRASPFRDFRIPGLALAFLVGGSAGAAAGASWRRRPSEFAWHLIAGAAPLVWIGAQVWWVRAFYPGQPILAGIGGALVALALADRMGRPVADPEVTRLARAFFAHGRVAFVGLSSRPDDFSRRVAREMAGRGLQVVPVNPRADRVGDAPCYAAVSDVPDPPAAVLIMCPASQALAIVDDCLRAGVKSVWFHRGLGSPGSASPAAVALAREAGLDVVTDACPLMYLEPVALLHRTHRRMRRVPELARAGRSGTRP